MTQQPKRLLLVEDHAADAVLLQEMLARDGTCAHAIRWVRSLRDALGAIGEHFDAILLDLSLPDSQGLDTIRQVSAAAGAIPILVVTGATDERIATEAVRCGAEDYLVKGETDARSIARAIQYAIDRRQAAERLHKEIQRSDMLLQLYEQSPRLTDKELYDFTVHQAVRLTDSTIGFLHLISDDQETVVVNTWNSEAMNNCRLADIVHFPVEQAGNWFDSARLKRAVVYNEFLHSPNQKGLPEGHVGVHRFMSIPILDEDKVRMVVGVGNKAEPYEDHDVVQLQLVANELYNIIWQRRVDAARKESEDKYRLLFNLTDDIICVHEGAGADGLPGKFLEVNDVACQKWGYTRDELLAMRPTDIDASDTIPNVPFVMERLKRDGRAVWEGVHLTKDGRRIPVEIGNVVIDFRGTPALLATARDISQRKRAEENQQRMQAHLTHVARLSSMGEMAAGIVHELGQPLYAILNYAKAGRNLLARDTPDLEGLSDYIDKIAEIASAAGSIGRRLRSFARRAEQERSVCDMHEIIQEAAALVEFEARQNKVRVETEPSPNSIVVRVSRVEIQQVLVNLLKNAFEAMAQTPEHLRRAVVRAWVDDGAVEVAVADQGHGLPPAEIARIFDAFVTTKPDGLGMGLTISATILENHGGRIWASPNPTGGVCFHFRLPLFRGERKNAN